MNAKAKSMSCEKFSDLPLTIINNILCLVTFKDAVRTSILSKKWRYNWVTHPKLVFDEKDMFDKTIDESQLTRKRKTFDAINQVLLLHQGLIREFSLSMSGEDVTSVEIDQIITHLARIPRNNNTIKKFTLDLSRSHYRTCYLPLSIFSFHQLTDLYVRNCNFDLNPTFCGFGSLTSLYFKTDHVSKEALLHLLSSCPVLKSLKLVLDINCMDEPILIIELFKCLPVIEHLSINRFLGVFEFDIVPTELPNALVHLKCFCVRKMMLLDAYGLRILGLVMRSSPNLEKIKIKIVNICTGDDESELEFAALEDCSDIWLEHLNELEILDFSNIAGELEFVELILAKAPVLKKVSIMLHTPYVSEDQELEISKFLLQCPRVSPFAEIVVGSSRD